jgi:hypothetical protein
MCFKRLISLPVFYKRNPSSLQLRVIRAAKAVPANDVREADDMPIKS